MNIELTCILNGIKDSLDEMNKHLSSIDRKLESIGSVVEADALPEKCETDDER